MEVMRTEASVRSIALLSQASSERERDRREEVVGEPVARLRPDLALLGRTRPCSAAAEAAEISEELDPRGRLESRTERGVEDRTGELVLGTVNERRGRVEAVCLE